MHSNCTLAVCCEPPRSSRGLCRKCSEVSYSISIQRLGSFSRVLLSRSSSHKQTVMWIREPSAFFSLERAAVVWAILDRILGYDTSLEMFAPRYLKFSTAASL